MRLICDRATISKLGITFHLIIGCLVLGLPLRAQIEGTTELGFTTTQVSRILLLPGEQFFFLGRTSDNIVRKDSSTGAVISRYEVGSTPNEPISQVWDFALDKQHTVHALLAGKNHNNSNIVRRFDPSGRFVDLVLSPLMFGRQIQVDADGNYHILGLPTELKIKLKDYARRKHSDLPSKIDLIYRFSATGQFLDSYFEFSLNGFDPVDVAEFQKEFPSLSQFLVLDDGTKYLLFQRLGNGPKGLVPQLYKISPESDVELLDTNPPFEGAWVRNLLPIGRQGAALEWHGEVDNERVIEVYDLLNGAQVYRDVSAHILTAHAIAVDRLVITRPESSSTDRGFRLFQLARDGSKLSNCCGSQ